MAMKDVLQRVLNTATTKLRGSGSQRQLRRRSLSLEPLEKRELLTATTPTVTFSLDSTSIAEDGETSAVIEFEIKDLGPTEWSVVNVAFSGSACNSGSHADYLGYVDPETHFFDGPGDAPPLKYTITAIDDTEDDDDEEVIVELYGTWCDRCTGNYEDFSYTATITIVDDDDPPPCTCPDGCSTGCESSPTDSGTVSSGLKQTTGNVAVQNSGSRLTYYSQFASGQQTAVAYSKLAPTNGAATLQAVEAKLTNFDSSTPNTTIWFDGTDVVADKSYAFAFPVDVSSLSSGNYDFTVQLTQHYSDSSTQVSTINESHRFINTLGSSMAAGWFPFGVSSLMADGSDLILMRSGMQRFTSSGCGGGWTHQSYADTSDYALTGDWYSGFTLTAKDGTVDQFATNGAITSTTDPAGNVTSYTYTSGKLTGITEPGSETTSFTYNASTGYIETMTKPDGLTSTYTLDANHRITAITKPDPDGAGPLSAPVTNLAYDATTGLLTSITFPDGSVQSYEYDHARALKKVVRTDGTEDTYESWFAAALVDTSGGVGTTRLNAADLIGRTDITVTSTVAGTSTTAKVDHFGFPLNAVDGEGNTTQYRRNGVGQVLKKTEPDPDGDGPLTSSVTEYRYDYEGNMTKMMLPDGSTREWEYDEDWAVPTMYTDETGSVTTYTIDSSNGNVLTERVIIGEDDTSSAETDDLVTTYTYTDASDGTVKGLVETITDPAGTITEYEYNSRGQKTQITYDSGGSLEASVEYEYDSTSGELLAQTDELGRRTEYVFDALNRRTRTIPPAADTTGTTIDNGDATGFATTGTWTTDGSQIYAAGSAGSPDATAAWEFTGLDADKCYEVFVSWTKDAANNASDAPFTIYDGTTASGTALETVDIDQSDDPDGSKLIGSSWHRLGTYALSGTTLGVKLNNDADGRVVADSVRILEHSATQSAFGSDGRLFETIDEAGRTTGYGYDHRARRTHVYREEADTTGKVVDDGDADFATSGTWTTDTSRGEDGDLRYAPSGSGTVTATWTFDELDPHKRYMVLTTWDADDTNNATDAPYSIYDGTTAGTLLDTVDVDQQVRPAILSLFGANWQSLGTFTPTGDTLTVKLTDDADGRVIADSVRVVEAAAVSETIYDLAGNVIGSVDPLGNVTEYEYDADGRQIKTFAPYTDVDAALQKDDGDAGVSLRYYTTVSDPDSVGGDYVEFTASNSYAGYRVTGVEPGTPYEVWVSYPVDSGNVTAANYHIYDGWYFNRSLIESHTVDQTKNPSGSAVFGLGWHYLGTVTPTEDLISVFVNGGVGVVADAVTIVETRAVTETVYDDAGRAWKQIDPYGNETEYVYDTSDRVIQTISPDPDGDGPLQSSVSRTHYDSSGRVSGTIDPVGNVRTTQYDALGRVEATYAGQVIAPTDDAYAETAGTWSDATGGFYGSYRTATTVTGTADATATWTFENLMLGEDYDVYVSWTADDTDGATDAHFLVYKDTTFLYQEDVDQTADPTEETDFLDFSSTKFEKLTTVTLGSSDPTTIVVKLANDSATASKVISADAVYLVRKDPMSESEYNDDGQLASTFDALGNETSYGYDDRGRQVDTTQPDPDGTGTTYTSPYLWRHYDAAGQMVATVGPDLRVDSVEYDGRGRTVATYAGKTIDDSTSGSFATTGTWTAATDGGLLDGYRTADSTDGATATATATWTFDNLIVGDDYDVYITWKSVASGADDAPVAIYQGSTGTTATWTGTLDQSSAPTADSSMIPFSEQGFAKLGSSITLTDSTLIVQLANNTGETGEVISADAVYVVRKDPMSQSVYNNDGALTTSIDADGNETTYTYDALGRVIAVTQPDPDGAGTDYESPVTRTYYNSAGQTSATLGPDGRTDTIGYDDLGRQMTTHTGQTITPSHDGYSEASGTWTAATGGFLGSYKTASTVTGSATAAATWTFTDLVPGEEYEVYVSWTADSGNADDAHFSVYLDSTAGTLVDQSDLDQTGDPDQDADFPGLGTARFELLTSYLLQEDDATTLVVQLSNDSASSGNTVAADAVYVVRKGANSESIYDFAGRLVATLDAAGNRTDVTYDDMGRRSEVLLPDPDGDGPLTRPKTRYVYDAASRVIETIQYEGDTLDYDQRGPEFYRVLGDSVDIGAYEGLVGPETSTYVVDTLVDESDGDYSSGDLSLREAIELADLNAGHDLITFDASLSGTIELSIGHLYIDSDLTIQGPGSGTITIDANGTSGTNRRVFYVTGDVTTIISGLTLTGGYADKGGAIQAYTDSDLTLIDLTVTGNTATYSGGGVFSGYGQSLVIENCTITENDAVAYGGGIASYSDRVYVYNTTISSNSVAQSYGAGMAAFYKDLEIVDCTISDNFFSSDTYAYRYGAGLFVSDGLTTRITRTTIENNKADAAGEYNATRGGGIAGKSDGNDIFITDSSISSNEADAGGGIYYLWSKLHLTRSTVEGNEAVSGGGMYGAYTSITMSDSLFADNTATSGAGMMVSTGAESSLTGVTVSGNTATNYGGGMYVYSTSPDLTELINCTVTDNTAGYGGGIYIYSAANGYVRLNNTIVAGNTGTSNYPDLRGYFDSGSSNNLIGQNGGLYGGIADGVRGNQVGTSASPIDPLLGTLAHNGGPTKTHMPQSSSPAVDAASTLLATTYFDGRGPNYVRTVGLGTDIGAVEYNPLNFLVDELTDGAGTTLQEAITAANANPGHDTITFSSGLDFSAAVDITLAAGLSVTGDLTIIGPGADQLTISGNDTYRILDLAAGTNVRLVGLTLKDGSATGAGGAIQSLADELTLEECQILDSTATTDGGGIYATGHVNLLESTLSGNSATDGGALMLNGASAFIRQSTVSGNSATNGAGIALETSADATILQSTIANNTASANGGGLKITSSNVLLQNTLVADNSATTAYPDVDGTVLADSSYNLISDGTGLSGITHNTSGNQVGTSASPTDAKLGDLGDHGGPVQTIPLRVTSPALDAGNDDLALTRLGRSSSVVYDALGRVVKQIATDPDGIGSQEASVTTNAYDAAGHLVSVTDPLGSTTTNVYDNLGRKTSTTDAESGCTAYTYDSAGRMASLTDPENNTTNWTFDPLGRVATETITVSSTDLTRSFEYDARGNLVRKIDRNGRVLDYTYDSLSRQTSEKWYDNLTDADVPQNVRKTYTATYDEASRGASFGDGDYDFDYTYSIFGNLTSTTQDLTGLTDDVESSYGYDVLGRKTSVSAAVGSTDDYVNAYSYDALGRITQITQDGVSGGNAVAEKRVDFGYSDDGTRATVSRFADLAGTKAVAETEKVFDELGRVTDIVHERAATDFADYDLTWDAAGRITDFDFDSLVGDDGDAAYSYDDTNQLTGSDYASDWQTDESYTYDDNGNRTNTGYTTGDHNRLTSDGTYNYTYDNEGNVLTKTNISTSESVEYTWDHRNRLTKVTFKNSSATATKIVEYAYDHGQRWVRKTLDTNADGTIDSSQVFIHDNGQIVLDFQKTGTAAAGNSDLANRYLWGTNVDELLTDELVDDGSEDDNRWALTDHLNSVRDLVVYNPVTGTVSVVKHVAYDAFGNITSDSAAALKSLFLYTARPFDADTDLQNNLNRWYDLSTGRWMSVDPIGFEAGDVNLYRYVGNGATNMTDPSGLILKWLVNKAVEKLIGDLNPNGGIGDQEIGRCECIYRKNTSIEAFAAINTGEESRLQLVSKYSLNTPRPGSRFPIVQVEYFKFEAFGRPSSKKRCDAQLPPGSGVHLNKQRLRGTPQAIPLEADGKKDDLIRVDTITWWTYVGC